ncbi:MAG: SpaH/EbpB family LPXTG-anchored major pilin [Bariatricus sp.]
MKHTKKLVSLLLTLVMVFAMASTTFAAQEGTLTGGSITINDAVPGQTYNAYQILYLESYNSEKNAYSYKANSAWETWLRTQTTYVSFDTQGYVTWVGGADVVKFAELAQVEAAKKEADATAVAPAAEEGKSYSTVIFSELKLGYYLVDTTLGSLCSLDTTNPSVVMEEKNEVPPIPDKQVKEDSTNDWGDNNTAQIGDTVEFRTTITAKKGAQNYVLHDQMSDGLTLDEESIEVTVNRVTLTKDTDYTVVINASDGCDFEIKFTQTYLDTITQDTELVVTYSAVLNDKAAIYPSVNPNKTKLDYGDNSSTEWDETNTYTFVFDIIKTDSSFKVLDGAEFELYDAETGENKINLVEIKQGKYRVATDEEANKTGFSSAVIKTVNGKATVEGLDSDYETIYWLEETKAPAGYNKLSGRVKVEMKEGNLTTTMTGDTWESGNGGVQITNNTGAELPSTGGMGTTIFYIIGSVLVLAAIVLLIVRKRMSDR